MLFHDSLAVCLLVLCFVLLCGDGEIRLFVSGLWRPVPLVGWRRGGCHMAGVLLAMLALVELAVPGLSVAASSVSGQAGAGPGFHPAASACLAVAALVLLGGGGVFCPLWGIPALVAYGVLPAGPGGLGLMAVCLWAAGRPEAGGAARLVALALLLGLGHGMARMTPLGWMLGAVLLTGCCLLVGRWQERLSLLRYCQLLRPLLLLGLVELSRQQGLAEGAQAALFALLLDMACQCLGVLWPHGRCLALVVPPLPGFIIGWVGLHAALGLGGSTEGWTVLGCVLAVLIMTLSAGEGLVILGEGTLLHAGSRMAWGLVLALLLPSGCGILAGALCGHGRQWASWLHVLPGGDGSVLALPLFWLGLFGLWAVLGRRRRAGEADSMMENDALPADGLTSGRLLAHDGDEGAGGLGRLRVFLHGSPSRPRLMRRLMMQGQKQIRSLRLSSMEVVSLLPVWGQGLVFWLLFLGGVLVVLGLGQ